MYEGDLYEHDGEIVGRMSTKKSVDLVIDIHKNV